MGADLQASSPLYSLFLLFTFYTFYLQISSLNSRLKQHHVYTPLRAKIQTLYRDAGQSQTEIAQSTGVPQRIVSRIVSHSIARRSSNHPNRPENRGHPRRFIKIEVEAMEEVLNNHRFEVKKINWGDLPDAISLNFFNKI